MIVFEVDRVVFNDCRPIAYRVELARELAVALERYAAQQDQKPETIIAEALRAYLGVDA